MIYPHWPITIRWPITVWFTLLSLIPTFTSTNTPHSNIHLYKHVKFSKIYKCKYSRHHKKVWIFLISEELPLLVKIINIFVNLTRNICVYVSRYVKERLTYLQDSISSFSIKLPFYGNRRFITSIKKVCNWTLILARLIRSTSLHPNASHARITFTSVRQLALIAKWPPYATIFFCDR